MNTLNISKPNIIQLRDEGYNLIDMHVHTSASSDCLLELLSVLEKAKEIGIGIAITDHDKIDSAISAVDNSLNVMVIPGIEVFAKKDKHVLFYFYDKEELIKFYNNEVKGMFLSKTVDELAKLKEKYKCIVGIAHPKGQKIWQNFSIGEYAQNIDFLEVLNGRCSKKKSLKVYKWVLKHKKGMTAGSDAHKLDQIGRCLICTKSKKNEVLDSIKKREISVIGLPLSKKEILKRAPKDIFELGLWILAKIYFYTGIKSLVKSTLKIKTRK